MMGAVSDIQRHAGRQFTDHHHRELHTIVLIGARRD